MEISQNLRFLLGLAAGRQLGRWDWDLGFGFGIGFFDLPARGFGIWDLGSDTWDLLLGVLTVQFGIWDLGYHFGNSNLTLIDPDPD